MFKGFLGYVRLIGFCRVIIGFTGATRLIGFIGFLEDGEFFAPDIVLGLRNQGLGFRV